MGMVPLARAGGSSVTRGLSQVPHLSGVQILHLRAIPEQMNPSGPPRVLWHLTELKGEQPQLPERMEGWVHCKPSPSDRAGRGEGAERKFPWVKAFWGGVRPGPSHLPHSRAHRGTSHSSTEEAGSVHPSVPKGLQDLVSLNLAQNLGCVLAQNPEGTLRFSGHPGPVPHPPTAKDSFPSRGLPEQGEHGSARKGGAGERRKWEEGWERN